MVSARSCVGDPDNNAFRSLCAPPEFAGRKVISAREAFYTGAGDISWPDLLDRRFDPDNKVVYYSVYQAIYDWRTAGGPP